MSTTPALRYSLFDADNHLYETQDSLTKYLPKQYKDAIQYVQVDGTIKIAIRGQISDYRDRAKIMGGNLARLVTV